MATLEIGYNLKAVIMDFMAKNCEQGRAPGYLLKESFGEWINNTVEKAIRANNDSVAKSTQKLPEEYKPGLGWVPIKYPKKRPYVTQKQTIMELLLTRKYTLSQISKMCKVTRGRVSQLRNELLDKLIEDAEEELNKSTT